jgi:hypothetical protein
MTDGHTPEHDAHLGEFAEELRLLAEAVLEWVEPVLRRAAVDGGAEWGGCSWCPLCAAAALARGEHHDMVATLAGHGTAIVTVLREALAGMPVDPILPTEDGADTADTGRADGPDVPPEPSGESSAAPSSPGCESRSGATGGKPRYVSIPVQIKG